LYGSLNSKWCGKLSIGVRNKRYASRFVQFYGTMYIEFTYSGQLTLYLVLQLIYVIFDY